jgi:hypothetical protein
MGSPERDQRPGRLAPVLVETKKVVARLARSRRAQPSEGPNRKADLKLPAFASVPAATTTAATPATATPPVPTAAAATAVPTAATPATPEPARPLGPILGFVDAKGATIERGAVHGLDRFLSLRRRAHRHEAEAARLSRSAVSNDVNIGDLADARERFPYRLYSGRERQVADIKTRPHEYLFSLVAATNPRSTGAPSPSACHPNSRGIRSQGATAQSAASPRCVTF